MLTRVQGRAQCWGPSQAWPKGGWWAAPVPPGSTAASLPGARGEGPARGLARRGGGGRAVGGGRGGSHRGSAGSRGPAAGVLWAGERPRGGEGRWGRAGAGTTPAPATPLLIRGRLPWLPGPGLTQHCPPRLRPARCPRPARCLPAACRQGARGPAPQPGPSPRRGFHHRQPREKLPVPCARPPARAPRTPRGRPRAPPAPRRAPPASRLGAGPGAGPGADWPLRRKGRGLAAGRARWRRRRRRRCRGWRTWRSTAAASSSTCWCACARPAGPGRTSCAATAGPSTTPTSTSGWRRSWSGRAWAASAWGAAASPTAPRRGRSTSTGTRWALGERTTP